MHLFTKSFIVGAISALPCSVSDWHEPTSPIVHGYQLQHLQVPSQENVKLRVAATCPAEMVEVDGMYCKDLVQTCVKERKRDLNVKNANHTPPVCEEFSHEMKCLSKPVHKHFCIDRYEHAEKDSKLPQVYISWNEAKATCESEGKRLCVVEEFQKACEGPNLLGDPIGYGTGFDRDKTVCNIDRPWHNPLTNKFEKIDKRVPIGSKSNCKSKYGVYDLNANVDEFVENPNGSYHHEPWVSTLVGGHAYGVRNVCRAMTVSHDPTFSFWAEGFRCCKAL